MSKFAFILLISLAMLSLGVWLWARQGTTLPASTEALLQDMVSKPIAPPAEGSSGYAETDTSRIWYKKLPAYAVTETSKGSVVLIHGLGSSSNFWPPYVYEPLRRAGYDVIISDHRGCGKSQSPINAQHSDYDLSDMVRDNMAIMDALRIKQAYVIGVSLGGMIGQHMAIEFPHRVKGLVSVMSTGDMNDPEFPASHDFKLATLKLFVRYSLIPSEANTVRMMLGIHHLLKGQQPMDNPHIIRATLQELRYQHGFNHKLPEQQANAMRRSGSRLAALSQLTIPVLVVHGDADPLIDIGQAKKYAAEIPQHESLWIQGMGHDLAPSHVAQWLSKSLSFMDALP